MYNDHMLLSPIPLKTSLNEGEKRGMFKVYIHTDNKRQDFSMRMSTRMSAYTVCSSLKTLTI